MAKGDEHFLEHIQRRTVKPPPVLYKYTTLDTARTILSTGRLRFQSPVRYNDPFDSQWDTLWPLRTPKALDYQRQLVEQAIRNPSCWPANAHPTFRSIMGSERQKIEALPEDQREREIDRFVQGAVGEWSEPEELVRRQLDTRRRLRVLCLSETDRSILMWSHYSDQHRGVVLGFNSHMMENVPKRPFLPMTYTDGPPVLVDHEEWARAITFGLQQPRQDESIALQWVLAKHTDWKYEREWRFVWISPPETLGDYEDIAFPRDALTEIVVGCRTDPVRSMELFSLAQGVRAGVHFTQMSRHPSRFELVKSKAAIGQVVTGD